MSVYRWDPCSLETPTSGLGLHGFRGAERILLGSASAGPRT